MIVKVCGMRDATNIRLVEQLGVDWMGFIFYPKSSRYVASCPQYLPNCKRVGVFVNADKAFILEHIQQYHLDFIQLHGTETPLFCKELGELTTTPIIKAFGIDADTNFQHILTYEGVAEYFLFDTRCNTAGGSGRSFDHNLLANYNGQTPFLLSGGLSLENVDEIKAVHHPKLIGYDLNSRFEISPALKSVSKLQTFLNKLDTHSI